MSDMFEPARRETDLDPLLSYIERELSRRLAPETMPEERDQHYRALLSDLRDRAARATSPQERAFLAQRASAIAHLRLEEARANSPERPRSAHHPASFGETIRRLRTRAGLSQSELAKRSLIDPAYVNRMEKAPSARPIIPSRAVLLRMAAALSLSPAEADALLVAAGYAPLALESAGGWRPEFTLVAEVLSDPLLTEVDRAEFRQVLRTLVARWRGRLPAGASQL